MAYRGLGDMEQMQYHMNLNGPVGVRPVDPVFDSLQSFLVGERVYLLRGRLAFNAGRYQEAIAAFEQAVQANPESVPALVNLGVGLVQIGEIESATEYFQQALTYDPGNITAHFNLGMQWSTEGRHKEAIQAFDSVLEFNPGDVQSLLSKAQSHIYLDQFDEAIATLYRALMPSNGRESIVIDLSELLIGQERYKDAIDLLNEAHRRFPDRGLTAHTLARLLAVSPDLSVRDGERAAELAELVFRASTTADHAETFAAALAEAGRCEEAVVVMTELIQQAEQGSDPDRIAYYSKQMNHYATQRPCRPGVTE
jgi:tetratricopeptide (TPR) repeat protein